jgi:hypothetical protein
MDTFHSPGEAAIGRAIAFGDQMQTSSPQKQEQHAGVRQAHQFGGVGKGTEPSGSAAESGEVVGTKVLPEFADAAALL